MMSRGWHYHSFLVSRQLGGAGLIALELAKWIGQRGSPARVWVPGSGPSLEAARRANLACGRYRLDSMFRGALRQLSVCTCLFPRLTWSPGWAHVHSPAAYRMLSPVIRLTGLRSAVAVQIEPTMDEIRWAFRHPPDLILPCSHSIGKLVHEALGDLNTKVRIVAMPNAVDTERFFPAMAKNEAIGSPSSNIRPIILMLANLAPHKGQETAIRAVAALRSRGIDAECWFAGIERDGSQSYEQYLRRLTETFGLGERVRFLGFRKDAPELLRAADFLLLPSTHEGLPLSILEAQASKVPVLAAPTAGIPEVITDGVTGFLVPATDFNGYADRIQLLLQHPAFCERMTQEAFARLSRHHTMAAYCKRMDDLFHSLMQAA